MGAHVGVRLCSKEVGRRGGEGEGRGSLELVFEGLKSVVVAVERRAVGFWVVFRDLRKACCDGGRRGRPLRAVRGWWCLW